MLVHMSISYTGNTAVTGAVHKASRHLRNCAGMPDHVQQGCLKSVNSTELLTHSSSSWTKRDFWTFFLTHGVGKDQPPQLMGLTRLYLGGAFKEETKSAGYAGFSHVYTQPVWSAGGWHQSNSSLVVQCPNEDHILCLFQMMQQGLQSIACYISCHCQRSIKKCSWAIYT